MAYIAWYAWNAKLLALLVQVAGKEFLPASSESTRKRHEEKDWAVVAWSAVDPNIHNESVAEMAST